MCNALKYDDGKPQVSMVNRSAMYAEARVLMFGAEKYGRDNWKLGMKHSRLLDASMRHILAYLDGEKLDPESGLCHLAHARTSLGFLLYYLDKGVGDDDL